MHCKRQKKERKIKPARGSFLIDFRFFLPNLSFGAAKYADLVAAATSSSDRPLLSCCLPKLEETSERQWQSIALCAASLACKRGIHIRGSHRQQQQLRTTAVCRERRYSSDGSKTVSRRLTHRKITM